MRKKSHISLSRYLLSDLDSRVCELKQRRGSFYVGSLLPDCIPSFIYRRHDIDSTFDILQTLLDKLSEELAQHTEDRIMFWIRLGIVTHYLADYCTYPHNASYPGTMKEHCRYEKELKYALRAYVKGDVPEKLFTGGSSDSSADLSKMITDIHNEYLCTAKKLSSDCSYIVEICRSVLSALLQQQYEIAGIV